MFFTSLLNDSGFGSQNHNVSRWRRGMSGLLVVVFAVFLLVPLLGARASGPETGSASVSLANWERERLARTERSKSARITSTVEFVRKPERLTAPVAGETPAVPVAGETPALPVLKQIELSKPLVIHWRYNSEETINLSPVSDGERVYLPLSAGQMISLRTDTGQLIWKTDVGGELSAAPVADERGVYVASENKDTTGKSLITSGALRLLGHDTGITLWVRPLTTAPGSALAMNEDTIFSGADDGRVYALRKSTGEVLWSKQVDSRVASQLTLIGSRLYVGSEFGVVYALEQKTGKLIWHYQTRGAIRGRFAVSNDLIYFGSADGYVYAVSEDTGKKRWRTRTGASVQSVLSVNDGLLATSFDNFVYFLSLAHGNRLWKRQLAGRLAAEPLATFDGVLFTPLSGDSGIVLNLKDGKLLNSLPLGDESGTAASPIIAGDVLMVTTRHGLLAFSRPKSEGS